MSIKASKLILICRHFRKRWRSLKIKLINLPEVNMRCRNCRINSRKKMLCKIFLQLITSSQKLHSLENRAPSYWTKKLNWKKLTKSYSYNCPAFKTICFDRNNSWVHSSAISKKSKWNLPKHARKYSPLKKNSNLHKKNFWKNPSK